MAINPSFADACHASAIALPTLFGAEITNIHTSAVTNFSLSSSPSAAWTKSQFSKLDFCNVTISYTYPGQKDNITVYVYLPPALQWNGRFATAGGGGWGAMMSGGMTSIPAIDAGFAVAETDAGVATDALTSADWALLSPGNPDINRLEIFASKALHDMAVIGKSVVGSFYGQSPAYSYWIGCSQGGRQGIMMAQRYPGDFDGILALAPAVNWGHFFPVMAWPHQRMYEEKAFPRACEFAALHDAAIEACDMLDGVQDGVISAPELCNFDPIGKINQPFFCKDTNSTLHFTTAAVKIAQSAWTGPRGSDGKFLWYGYAMDADLSMITATTCKDAKSSNPANCSANPFSNAASCDEELADCTAVPFPLSDSWFRHWVTADPELDTTSLSRDEFTSLIHQGIQHYDSIIGTRDPDLSAFQKHGGKLLTWHGITDQIIPFGGSTSYHDRVASLDPRVNDYFRLFLAPGTAHCLPGDGPFPYRALEDLIEWVERGVAPERLVAQRIEDLDAETGLLRHDVERAGDRGKPLCLYPKRQEYIGGDAGVMGSYRCVSP
ncbi:tannase and feruloyl esterase [Aureobasidium pullulans]|nr:tannase and feruloyl esterase [Aureobasidium pullulans]